MTARPPIGNEKIDFAISILRGMNYREAADDLYDEFVRLRDELLIVKAGGIPKASKVKKKDWAAPVVWTMCAKGYHALCDDDQARLRGSVRRCGCECHKEKPNAPAKAADD
jgi:hypothetical protein